MLISDCGGGGDEQHVGANTVVGGGGGGGGVERHFSVPLWAKVLV